MSAATTLTTTTSSSSSSSSSLSSSSSSTKSKMLFCGSLGRRRRRRNQTTTKITSTSSSSTKETTREEEEQESGGLAKTERNLGRSAMLGFAATTLLDASTDGLGPIEQLIGEEKSLVTHVVNPVNLAKDLLEVTGLYVESILLVWVFLSGVFLLAVTSGLRKPTTTTMSGLSRPNGENRVDAMAGVVKSAWREQVRENKKYELFNGRLAMLGITASFIGDYFLAEGPMEQVAQELGVPVIDQEIFALVFLSAASFLLVSTLVRVGRRALTESN
jgi:photosystem II protein